MRSNANTCPNLSHDFAVKSTKIQKPIFEVRGDFQTSQTEYFIFHYQPSVLTFQGEQHRYLLHRPDQQQAEASPVQHTQRPWQHDDWRQEEAKFQDGF